jgi:hypothetical protein
VEFLREHARGRRRPLTFEQIPFSADYVSLKNHYPAVLLDYRLCFISGSNFALFGVLVKLQSLFTGTRCLQTALALDKLSLIEIKNEHHL